MYDADGTVRGELAYLVQRATRRAHCALCDISHGTLRRRPAFDRAIERLPVPIRMLHRNELSAAQAAAAAGALPCILAVSNAGVRLLIDGPTLEQEAMDPDGLVDAIVAAAAVAGLELGAVG